MRTVTVNLPDATFATLAELAAAEYRGPRQHATALLLAAVDRAARAKRNGRRTPERTVDRTRRP